LNVRSSTNRASVKGSAGDGAVLTCPWQGFLGAVLLFGTPFWIARMTSELLCHRLELLGWKALDEGRQEDGRYCILVESCGHFVLAFADTRSEALTAATSLALRLTCGGLRPSRL
jgi:hypothetical protein